MYNGRIIKSSRKVVEGTHKMMGYSDHWDESYDIEFDGELTCTVCEAIVAAFMGSKLYNGQSGSSYGALRWSLADSDVRVNVDTRQLIVSCGQGLCD